METFAYNLPGIEKLILGSGARNATGPHEGASVQMLMLSRCVLAFSALVIVWINDFASAGLLGLTYCSIAIYCIFSVFFYFISIRANWSSLPKALHWTDAFFCASLAALTSGIGGVFLIVYPILVASFFWGFSEGMLVTVSSLFLFTVIELSLRAAGYQSDFDRTLPFAPYLFIFGYMVSFWGGHERGLRRRLALLKDISDLLNPRFGVDHAYGLNLNRLLEFYDGSSCILVLRHPSPLVPTYVMYIASRNKPENSATPRTVTEGVAATLLHLPDTLAAFYHGANGSWRQKLRGYYAYDFELKVHTEAFLSDCTALANVLDTQAFVTAPYAQHDGTTGRIFLTSSHGRFARADIDFLIQASNAISAAVENMSLVEELVSKAADHERQNISRDLHDTTIQPYIGLKLALDALYREGGENNALSKRISELIDMADMTITDLRDYASTLKERESMPGEYLVKAVKQQTERLGRFYGIKVEVKSKISSGVDGHLAAEAFKIISEGLSNILRHTSAKNAFIYILCENLSDCDNLLLQLGNEVDSSAPVVGEFMPRSINERARALGGKIRVEHSTPDGYTVVHVTIPI